MATPREEGYRQWRPVRFAARRCGSLRAARSAVSQQGHPPSDRGVAYPPLRGEDRDFPTRSLSGRPGRTVGRGLGKKIGQWARREYIRSSWTTVPPLMYAYQDVAEAMVVHELESRGIRPHVIGDAVKQLRERYGTEWPLQRSNLLVPQSHPHAKGRGRTVALRTDDGIWDLSHHHLVLRESDLVSIARDLSRGGWAARDLPNLRYIEVNPDRLSGRPTIRGRRIAAQFVAATV